ncbi:hypothetical protein, conserved [Trypanosoma brucei brucei TREU927]|uniref:Uncharacterized protein n=3 Tax=Trypanozoon TaxID=39700 RepID=Q385H2_TRYB2|nr:hypothetical protein, conserved [Trypanosoma brucei brucei TREU927]EAN79559.1 hypothetical protein, conserved [Trypanosoma brucei brucei TREU927]
MLRCFYFKTLSFSLFFYCDRILLAQFFSQAILKFVMFSKSVALVFAIAFVMEVVRAAAPDPAPGGATEKEFPLVWVCLGITVVGIGIALYVAHRRPDELHIPGASDEETEEMTRADGPENNENPGANETAADDGAKKEQATV